MNATTQPLQHPAAKRGGGTFGYGAFFLVLGVTMAYFAYAQASEFFILARRGAQTEAVVVSMETTQTRRGATIYRLVVQFTATEGHQVRATVATAVSPSDFPRGTRTKVVYDPADPTLLRLPADVASGPGASEWVLGVMALLMLGLGTVMVIPRRRAVSGRSRAPHPNEHRSGAAVRTHDGDPGLGVRRWAAPEAERRARMEVYEV